MIQIHQYIDMSQDLTPSICSSLVIFMYWVCVNHNFNAMPTEKVQQHPLVFAMNRTYCTFFLCIKSRLYLAPPSHLVKALLCCYWESLIHHNANWEAATLAAELG